MRIYVFLAEGFEEIEAIAPIDIFRRASIDTITVSISDKKEVTGAHGITVLADTRFIETDFDENALLFLPGGIPGATNLDNHIDLNALIKQHAANNQKLAAICAAPLVFGKLGLLEGKEAICYPGFEAHLEGASLSNASCLKAGSIYTAKAAGAALDFALMLVADLKGEELAKSIREAMFIA